MKIEPYPTKLPPIGYTQKQLKPPNQAGRMVAQFKYQSAMSNIEGERLRTQQKRQMLQAGLSGLGTITEWVKRADEIQYSKQFSEAKISATKEMDDFLLQLQKDPDYESYDEKYMEKANQILQSVGKPIKNNRAQKDFTTWYNLYAENRRVDVAVQSRKLVVQNGITTLDNGISGIIENVADPAEAKQQVTQLLMYNESIGVIKDFEALAREQSAYHTIDFKEFTQNSFGIYENALQKTGDPDFAKNTALEYIMGDRVPENVTSADREQMHKSIKAYSEERRLEMARKAQELDDDVTTKAMRDVMEGRLTNRVEFSSQLVPNGAYNGMSPGHVSVIYYMLKALQKADKGEVSILDYENEALQAQFMTLFADKYYDVGRLKNFLREHQIRSDADIKNLDNKFGVKQWLKLWNLVESNKHDYFAELTIKQIEGQVFRGERDLIAGAKIINEVTDTSLDEAIPQEEKETRIKNALEAVEIKKTRAKIVEKVLEWFGSGETTEKQVVEAAKRGVFDADLPEYIDTMNRLQNKRFKETFGKKQTILDYLRMPNERTVYGIKIGGVPIYMYYDIDVDSGKGLWYSINPGFKMDTSKTLFEFTSSPIKMGKDSMQVFIKGKYQKINFFEENEKQKKEKSHLLNIGQ